jgi:phosphatidylserine/phosphatidylglycerophosphate/cardiolipin synthase-like enzyme
MDNVFRDTKEIDRILTDTYSDFVLSKGERSALRSVLSDATDGDLAVWRHRLFAVARTLSGKMPPDHLLISWLEDMVKLLLPKESPSATAKAWFSPREDCALAITGLISRTIKSIDLCVFTITDDRLSDEILRAHERKVQIRILTDNEKSRDGGSDALRLAQAGIPVYIDTSPFHMHHKFGIFDNRTLITGSYNWTRSASRDNEENIVLLEDASLVGRFRQEFELLLSQNGTRRMIDDRK